MDVFPVYLGGADGITITISLYLNFFFHIFFSTLKKKQKNNRCQLWTYKGKEKEEHIVEDLSKY